MLVSDIVQCSWFNTNDHAAFNVKAYLRRNQRLFEDSDFPEIDILLVVMQEQRRMQGDGSDYMDIIK